MARCFTSFKDILEPRRQETSNFMWISRELKTVVAYKQHAKSSPKWHKQEVLKSAKIQDIIRKICEKNEGSREDIERQIWLILDEIGYNKRLHVIRWLGLVLTKICVKVCAGIHVNEANILRMKHVMGNTPVIFLPSHRSYADFILLSYICFNYDIEIPAIAAGMDFHGMWGMGSILRDTGAFFMRRSYNNDSLYWDTFRQYIHQLITKGDLPMEFFIEGTRSRTGKSLMPKFGLLSMVLKPFFTSEVPDILFVPINISYDRVLEEKLFAYELLGVPKPKESTSAFFKSLSIIKERYGNIYVDFAKPISARDFFGLHIDRSVHSIKPLHMQEISQQERDMTASLAHEIINTQQKCSVITAFNLVALSLTNNFMCGRQLLQFDDLIKNVIWLKTILEALGALTDIENPSKNVWTAFNTHRNLVQINDDLKVDLVTNAVALNNLDVEKLKGHALSEGTVLLAVPFIMLQIYVNPVLHYFISPAILVVILKHREDLSEDELFGYYGFLRSLLSYEFVTHQKWDRLVCGISYLRLLFNFNKYINIDFRNSLQQLQDLDVVNYAVDKYCLSNNNAMEVFSNVLQPFLFSYYVTCKVLIRNPTIPLQEKEVIVMAQAQLESFISKSENFIHPYCLSLDTLTNCLASLTAMSAMKRDKINWDSLCQPNYDVLYSIINKLETYIEVKLLDENLNCIKINTHFESKL